MRLLVLGLSLMMISFSARASQPMQAHTVGEQETMALACKIAAKRGHGIMAFNCAGTLSGLKCRTKPYGVGDSGLPRCLSTCVAVCR